MFSIGLDVGGTKILGVVVDAAAPATVLTEHRVPTPAGGDGLVATLADLVGTLVGQAPAPGAVGIGVPGLVDRDGRLRMGPHLPRVVDLPLAEVLTEEVGLPVVADNDANCHAVGEAACGAAAGVDDALVVTLGTGIGAGIIAGGQLLRGASGFAGEPGHMVVDPDGPACPCGRRGCWEQLASGTGLARLAQEAARAGHLVVVTAQVGGDPDDVRGELVTAAARTGDAESLAVLRELSQWIALGLANLVNILDPAVVVVGGGLVDAADLILPEVRARFADRLLGGHQRPVLPILAAALGDRAGAIGAAVLAARAA